MSNARKLADLLDASGDVKLSNLDNSTALPLAGGAMTGAITTNSTFDGVDIATRDAILTSTTTTAGAALPKAGGTMTGDLTVSGSAPRLYIKETDSTDGNIRFSLGGGDFYITSVDDNLGYVGYLSKFSPNGDISFYEDTGTTAKLFWDASAESLGIGTTSPTYLLDIENSAGDAKMSIVGKNTHSSQLLFGDTNDSDIGKIMYDHGADLMSFRTNNTTHLRIDSSGNVGIGTSSPSLTTEIKGDTGGPATTGTSQTGVLRLSGGTATYNVLDMGVNESTDQAWIQSTRANSLSTSDSLCLQPNGDTLFYKMTSKTQAISTGAAAYFSDSGSTNDYASLFIGHNSAQKHGIVLRDWNNGGGTQLQFNNYLDATSGSISMGNSSTTYNTSSDYRLKEDVKPMSASIDRLKELKPVNFAWKLDGSRVDGFLAHEAQEVVPEAITGTKDAMRTKEYEVEPAIEATYDEEGNELTPAVEAVMGEREVEDYQGIDQSKLVPLLTSALQEAVAKIEELTTRIETLEAN